MFELIGKFFILCFKIILICFVLFIATVLFEIGIIPIIFGGAIAIIWVVPIILLLLIPLLFIIGFIKGLI